MLSKKLRVFLLALTTFVVMSTMSFATDVETPTETTAETTNQEDISVTSDSPDTTDETTTSISDETTSDETTSESTQSDVTTHEGDIYKTGDNIEISEAINGNVFVSGTTVKVTGQIGGDLFVCAQTLNIDGAQIYGNVFAIADNIILNGLIYDLYGICNELNVPYNGTVYRDLKAMCKNATIDGVIGGNVNVKASNSLTIENDCVIYKDLNYTHDGEITVPENTVRGSVNYTASSFMDSSNIVLTYIMSFIGTLAFTLVVWLLITFFAPKFKANIEKIGKTKPVVSILTGLITVIAVPVVSFLLFISSIGTPISIALMVAFALVFSITFTLTTIALADILAKKVSFFAKYKNIFAIILVALILWALIQIPYVGLVITALIPIYGFGMFVLSVLNKTEKKAK